MGKMEISEDSDIDLPLSDISAAQQIEKDTVDAESVGMPNIRNSLPYILNGVLYKIVTQNGEHVTVKCTHCPADRIYRGSIRSTGNFHMHIKRRHPDLLRTLEEMKVNAMLKRRKVHKRNIKVDISPNNTVSKKSMVKQDTDAEPIPSSRTLKIKKAFQRHQQEAMRNRIKPKTERLYQENPLDLSIKDKSGVDGEAEDNANAQAPNVQKLRTSAIEVVPNAETLDRNNNGDHPTTATPSSSNNIDIDETTLNIFMNNILALLRNENRFPADNQPHTTANAQESSSGYTSPFPFNLGFENTSLTGAIINIRNDISYITNAMKIVQNEVHLQSQLCTYLFIRFVENLNR